MARKKSTWKAGVSWFGSVILSGVSPHIISRAKPYFKNIWDVVMCHISVKWIAISITIVVVIWYIWPWMQRMLGVLWQIRQNAKMTNTFSVSIKLKRLSSKR